MTMDRGRWLARVVCTTLLIGSTSACGETGPVFRNVSVEVSPPELVLDAIGAQGTFDAAVSDGRGDEVFGARVRWRVVDPSVAEVDDAGVVTARAAGSTTVIATATGLGILEASGSATVRVVPVVAAVDVLDDGGGTAPAGTPLPAPVRVRALDRLGSPVADGPLRFEVVDGGGSVTPADSRTDPEGVASAFWTLGAQAGAVQRLAVGAPAGPALATVEATAVAGPPAGVLVEPQPPAFGVRGRPLATPVQVRVVDAFGNSGAGVPVRFEPGAGAGSVTPMDAVSDGEGRAATVWTLGGSAGLQILTVGAGTALTDIALTATEPPAVVSPVAGTAQSAAVATAVPIPPTVRVTDAGGAPVPGVAVSFE
ncbi:MAG: Ig-like domain-containing protein, partial [Gemmatimonadetes bacterium]|nr:Ig-like domain-containing protein [Gemmatimonadota bacterium]